MSDNKQMNLQLLMQEYMKDEQLKIDELPWESDPQLAYQKLEERIALIEGIAFEAKSRAVKLTGKKRELEVSNWTKDNVVKTLKDPRERRGGKPQEKKKELTKLEKTVQGFISLGSTDAEVLEMMSQNNKFEKNEIWRAIETVRGIIPRTVTEEQAKAIAEDK